MIEAAVFGFGTVGSGVVELIDKNQEQICRQVPEGIHIKYILDIREFPGSPYADRVVHDIEQILSDPEIRICCETMGGKEPAFTFTRRALEKGISVCTSNKELVESRGTELLKVAREHQCSYLFEASVGGGIPILRPLRCCLAQEDITSVMGILNGTTNYILTKMENEKAAFEDVLKKAQEMGYAERNPEADIEGHDCCRKIAILASLITGKKAAYEEIPCEGITDITQEDFEAAAAIGRKVKLLGVASRKGNGHFAVRTAPFLLTSENPLYAVSDVFNGILVHGNMVDDLMFYGRGAGKDATASAVVSDVIELALTAGHTIPGGWSEEKLNIASGTLQDDEVFRYMIRVDIRQKEAAISAFGISEEAAEGIWRSEEKQQIAFVTEPMSDQDFEELADAVSVLGSIRLIG